MSAHLRSKTEAVIRFSPFAAAAAAAGEAKTNKDCDNRSLGIVNPGGAVFNPHLSFKQSDGFILKL